MPFDNGRLYPILVDALGNPAPIRRMREHIIPSARGEVLEIGAGTGANFRYYSARGVTRLFALEPDPRMVSRARKRIPDGFPVEFLGLRGENIPLEDCSVDTVVTTFTLCTLAGVEEVIKGIRRVLKPTGRLLFLEIGLARNPSTRLRQTWYEPIAMRLFAGLCLTRDIPRLIVQGGFRLESVQSSFIAKPLKAWTHCWWGTAFPDQAFFGR